MRTSLPLPLPSAACAPRPPRPGPFLPSVLTVLTIYPLPSLFMGFRSLQPRETGACGEAQWDPVWAVSLLTMDSFLVFLDLLSLVCKMEQ